MEGSTRLWGLAADTSLGGRIRMLKEVKIVDQGRFDATGSSMAPLGKINFIYGANGSGKTTISRIINDAGRYPSCKLRWDNNTPIETRVYNQDFVKEHFVQSDLKGIYTFGENAKAQKEIDGLTSDLKECNEKLARHQGTLNGGDDDDGKGVTYLGRLKTYKLKAWKAETSQPPICGKRSGASDGARTRDLRRDRPTL